MDLLTLLKAYGSWAGELIVLLGSAYALYHKMQKGKRQAAKVDYDTATEISRRHLQAYNELIGDYENKLKAMIELQEANAQLISENAALKAKIQTLEKGKAAD